MPTKPRKRKRGKFYFTVETQDAIVRYNASEDDEERDFIFRKEIYKPLDKLAENIINRFKFPYMDYSFKDVKDQVVSFLVLNLHKYKPKTVRHFLTSQSLQRTI